MDGEFQVGPWLVQPGLNLISRNGLTASLEPKVMEVLVCLATHPGEALPKEKLLRTVWPDTFVTEDALKRCISELRRVLGDNARDPCIIETIPKRGYRLIARVEPKGGVTDSSAGPAQSPLSKTAPPGGRQLWAGWVALAGAILVSLLLIGRVGRRAKAGAGAPIRSLAVLPLQNLSTDPAQEYFSDGMTDALITELAQIPSVKVISRTSSMQYKQTRKSMPEIARELKVEGIIEGTVQRSGDRVRITAQLIRGPADKHIWAESYERDLRDVFALERDVAKDIANQVEAQLADQQKMSLSQPRLVDPAVLDAYVQGTYHLNGRGRGGGDEEEKKAQSYFQRAIDLDPTFAPAYRGLAEAYAHLSRQDPQDAVIRRRAAEKAVELEPFFSDALVTLGDAKTDAWEWHGAEEDYRRAIAVNPNSADAHEALGIILTIYGRLDEGWKEYEVAQELDPNRDHLADALYARGKFDQAIEIRRRVAVRDPGDGLNHYALAMNYAQKGMFKEFAAEMGEAAKLYGMPEIAARLEHAQRQSGGEAALQQWVKELEHFAAERQLYMPGDLAELYSALGDKDRAFYWLEEYRQNHTLSTAEPTETMYFKTNPWFDPIRSDQRFSDFLRQVGLSP